MRFKTPTQLATQSLLALSLGDAFGQSFFGSYAVIEKRIQTQELLPAPWIVTDDTIQALAVYRILALNSEIDCDQLARILGQYYCELPNRGYGGTACGMLHRYGQGESWQDIAPNVFDGQGSKGNGCAMRIPPLGAFFANKLDDDIDVIVRECEKATVVTHTHDESVGGALAVALAAAYASNHSRPMGKAMLQFIVENIPDCTTRGRLKRALDLPDDSSSDLLLTVLGNSISILVEDTVPFCLWQAAMYSNNYEEAMWRTMIAGGDKDTTCAIVGGIIGTRCEEDSIPQEWLVRCENPHQLFPITKF